MNGKYSKAKGNKAKYQMIVTINCVRASPNFFKKLSGSKMLRIPKNIPRNIPAKITEITIGNNKFIYFFTFFSDKVLSFL